MLKLVSEGHPSLATTEMVADEDDRAATWNGMVERVDTIR